MKIDRLCKHPRLSEGAVFEELVDEDNEQLLMQFTHCLDCSGWIYTGPDIRIDLKKDYGSENSGS